MTEQMVTPYITQEHFDRAFPETKMTEHFTREEAVALAHKTPMDDQLWMDDADEITAIHELCNAAVTAKLKEWDAQGAVAKRWLNSVTMAYQYGDKDLQVLVPHELLFSHALPAQPAEPVNAELVDALRELAQHVGPHVTPNSLLAQAYSKATAALSRAQAAQPVAAVPEAKHKPLHIDQLIVAAYTETGAAQGTPTNKAFVYGVRWAEQNHGITAHGEQEQKGKV